MSVAVAVAVAVAKIRFATNQSTRTAAKNGGVSQSRVSYAEVVLRFAPDLADAVLSGATSLDEAYRRAQEAKAASESRESVFAEMQAGVLYRESMKATAGDRAGRKSELGSRNVKEPNERPPTLKELGISETQSSRWQQLAEVPQDQFEAAYFAALTSTFTSVCGTLQFRRLHHLFRRSVSGPPDFRRTSLSRRARGQPAAIVSRPMRSRARHWRPSQYRPASGAPRTMR